MVRTLCLIKLNLQWNSIEKPFILLIPSSYRIILKGSVLNHLLCLLHTLNSHPWLQVTYPKSTSVCQKMLSSERDPYLCFSLPFISSWLSQQNCFSSHCTFPKLYISPPQNPTFNTHLVTKIRNLGTTQDSTVSHHFYPQICLPFLSFIKLFTHSVIQLFNVYVLSSQYVPNTLKKARDKDSLGPCSHGGKGKNRGKQPDFEVLYLNEFLWGSDWMDK